MPLIDFVPQQVPGLLTPEDVRIFASFRVGGGQPSVIAPTTDPNQDRLIYELARRPTTLALVRPLLGPDILLWWAGLDRADEAGSRLHAQVQDGGAAALLLAICPGGTIDIGFARPGLPPETVRLTAGSALCVPAQTPWRIVATTTPNSKLLTLGFAAPNAALCRPNKPDGALPGVELSGNCHAGDVPVMLSPRRGSRNAFALPAISLQLEPTSGKEAVQTLLDGHTDVLNSLRVWVSDDRVPRDLPGLAETLVLPLEPGRDAAYRPAASPGADRPHGPHLGLAWTGAPLGLPGVASAGALAVGGSQISTAYLRSLTIERLALGIGEQRQMGYRAADTLLVLQAGECRVGGMAMTAPAVALLPAGVRVSIEGGAEHSTMLMASLTGVVSDLAPTLASRADGAGTVVFCIPLISRARATDWARVCHLVDATIRSIIAQTDPAWRIILVGSDAPTLTAPIDDRCEFIATTRDFGDGSLRGRQADAGYKRNLAERYARARGAGFIFFCDSDDLVSRHLVAAIREANHPYGCILGRGYIIDAEQARIAPLPLKNDVLSLDEQSASCAAFNTLALESIVASDVNRFGHVRFREAMYREGRPMLDLPLRGSIYARFTSTNMSDLYHPVGAGAESPAQHLRDAIDEQAVPMTEDLRGEFGLDALLGEQSGPPSFGPRRLSVLVCTHGRPQGLAQLLETLMPQVLDHPERELVIVNDGTHDQRYSDVIAPFTGLVRYEALPRSLGIAGARNRSAELARGDYLVFTDDDCEVPLDWLDWLEATLDTQPELDVVAGTALPLRPETAGLVGRVQVHYGLLPTPHDLGGLDQCYVTACLAVRSDMFRRLGGFGGRPLFSIAGEDTDLSVRLIRAGARTRIDPDWHSFHTLGTSVRTELRRFRRYGYANMYLGRDRDGPLAYRHLQLVRRRDLPRKFLEHLRTARANCKGLAGGSWDRLVGPVIAAAIRTAYDAGAAAAATGRPS